MPQFTYQGPGAMFYTETRDATGHNLGEVQPGDIRDLDRAPDQWWHETASDGDQTPPEPAPDPAPADGSVPAAPAVIPGA